MQDPGLKDYVGTPGVFGNAKLTVARTATRGVFGQGGIRIRVQSLQLGHR